MALGATGNPNEVERFGEITAQNARAVGLNWALAPVADVNSNPANSVINDRSFGEDPEEVSKFVAAFIRGAHRGGILVAAKHFPGHGESAVDSHRGIPTIDGDRAHLEKFELPPFKAAIAAGTDSILLAHARVPALDSDPNKVATISPKIVSTTLKERLGFTGVVITDALEMKGITTLYDSKERSPTARAAVDAIKAGCDVIMLPTDLDGAFHAIIDAIHRGEIPESRINESVRKVLQMKAAAGLNESRFVDLDKVEERTSRAEDMEFAQRIADEAVTLVRHNGSVLPLSKKERGLAPDQSGPPRKPSLVVVELAEVLEGSSGREFEKAIKDRRPDAAVYYVDNRGANSDKNEILKDIGDAEQVVVAAFTVHGSARQVTSSGVQTTSFGLMGASGQFLHRILEIALSKTVVIALGSPYIIEDFPEIQTYACTYAMATTSEISAVKAIFGEIRNFAKLPITLPKVANRGFSLPWPQDHSPRAPDR
jgi:beta-N-acetylhexosaminidase